MDKEKYQVNFHLTGLTATEYSEVLSYVTKIGTPISFGGGVDNMESLRQRLIDKIASDLTEMNIDEDKKKELISNWKKFIW